MATGLRGRLRAASSSSRSFWIFKAGMLRKALKVVTELHFRTVSCPGVHLGAKDDLYLSVCVMGQYRTSKYGETLAWFEEDSRHFLFPEPKLVPSYSGVGREVLMTRAPHFPGIAPQLEFWTKTTIGECSAVAEGPYSSTKSSPRARKQRAASPRRRPATAGVARGGGAASDGGRRRVAFQQGSSAQRMLGSWPGAGGRSSPPLRRSTLSSETSPAPSNPTPMSHVRSMSADGRRESQACSSSSSESDTPIGQRLGASPSSLWRSYRQQASYNGRSRWSDPADSWEEVQERVRGMLTTPKAVRRLHYDN
ncbi:hypothetical protein CRUP_029606 [Coryphaenoides rupestris]|nr:hypothetical protein CRUP_029606 [Coryphaenoides rupestris]